LQAAVEQNIIWKMPLRLLQHVERLNLRIASAAAFAGFVLGLWIFFSPGGLLGKADAIGYAVCHRIFDRSFSIGERQAPLCARCTGMYLGAMVCLLYQSIYGKRGKLPSPGVSITLGFFLLLFGIDGLNSYLQFFPAVPHLYESQNWLRLATGCGVGIGMSAMLYPIFQQTVWTDWQDAPALNSWKQMGAVILITAVAALAAYSQNPLLFYPLALLSAGTILVLLTMIYSIILVLLRHKDNTFQHFEDALAYIFTGMGLAVLQISAMDAVRFLLTGTWNGFFIPTF